MPFITISTFAMAQENSLQDELSIALEEYNKESSSIGQDSSPEERQVFYRKWYQTISSLINVNDNHPRIKGARIAVLGLANSLGEYAVSRDIAQILLAETTSPEEQTSYHRELGEIGRRMYLNSRDTADAAFAISHFSEARQLHVSGDPSQSDWNVRKECSTIRYLAELYTQAMGDHVTAANLYKEGNDLFTNVSKEAQVSLKTHGWGPEYWLSNEMTAAARAGNIEEARSVLDILSGYEEAKFPGSYYLAQLAEIQFPEGGEGLQKIIEEWLNNRPPDAWTAFLLFHLAKSYEEGHTTESDLKAIGYYRRIIDQYRSVLEQVDAKALANGKGGYLAYVLASLAHLYDKLGDRDSGRAYLLEFLERFPNDDRAKLLAVLLKDAPTTIPAFSMPNTSESMGHIVSDTIDAPAITPAIQSSGHSDRTQTEQPPRKSLSGSKPHLPRPVLYPILAGTVCAILILGRFRNRMKRGSH